MKLQPMRRRAFLTGAGAVLAMPFLSSLAPKGVRAQLARPIRYLQIFNPYGASTSQFYGGLTPAMQVEEFVGVRPLSDVDGDISALIGPKFTPLKSKFSLLHGFDVIVQTGNHHMCFPSCASSYASGLDGDNYPPVSGQPSVDVMMANSGLVYDETVPQARRVLLINPLETDGYTRTRTFSWQATSTGEIEMLRPTKTTIGLTDILATGFGELEAEGASETLLLNAVHGDYQRVRDSPRISEDDRNRLEAYMALIHDVSRGAGSCSMPTLDEEVDIERTVQNQFRLVTAAMLCDLTRIASMVLGTTLGYDVRHTDHHDFIANSTEVGLFDDLVLTGSRVGDLLTMMEAAPDGEGETLLDNSIVYWSMQYGNARPGDSHRPWNMPAMVAGRAGGQLNTGYYIDYRKDGHLTDHLPRGIPQNNLLVTFMNCMGMSSSHYEPASRPGYGYYDDAFFENPDRPNPARWNTTEGRRSPLPFFYQGERRG